MHWTEGIIPFDKEAITLSRKRTQLRKLYGKLLVWEIAVHLAVACDVYDGVFLCCPFSHGASWMRS